MSRLSRSLGRQNILLWRHFVYVSPPTLYHTSERAYSYRICFFVFCYNTCHTSVSLISQVTSTCSIIAMKLMRRFRLPFLPMEAYWILCLSL
jgi:hypothetical protein